MKSYEEYIKKIITCHNKDERLHILGVSLEMKGKIYYN